MAAKTPGLRRCGSKSVAQQRGQATKNAPAAERGSEAVGTRQVIHQHRRYQLSKMCTASRRSLGTQPSRYQCYGKTADRQGCAVEVTRIFCEWLSLVVVTGLSSMDYCDWKWRRISVRITACDYSPCTSRY